MEKLEVELSVYFPIVKFDGTYDVNAKFVNMPVVGKGPIKGNASKFHECISGNNQYNTYRISKKQW